MKQKIVFLLTLCISFLSISAQDIDSTQLNDHEFFIEKLENSQDEIYYQVIDAYDEYLRQHPEDVLVEIQKCKFVQYAQYDEYDDYNPNQEYFDTCKARLERKAPYHPAVLLFLTTCTWGDDIEAVFDKVEVSLNNNPEQWSKEQLGAIYFEMGQQHYYDED